jgi:YrbI family 3-deoxy-D-manno-octulosonate 8-phosphate phosphatase
MATPSDILVCMCGGGRPEGRDEPEAARVLAIVPARGGSKGIPRKNLALLDGHPLVAWSVVAAVGSPLVDRTVCSTDDEEIAAAAVRYGAEVLSLRPPALSGDHIADLPVFQHVVSELALDGWRPDIVVQLRPTTPFRRYGLVDDGIRLLAGDIGATSVRSVSPAPLTPFKMWWPPDETARSGPYLQPLISGTGIAEPWNAPRQSLPTVLWHNGVLDVIRADTIDAGSMTGERILPIVVEPSFAVDIDDAADLERARSIVGGLVCVRPGESNNWGQIRLLVLDVDGTLTPGSMYYSEIGEALKEFHTHDGQGIGQVRASGVEVALITQEATGFTKSRADKLGIVEVAIGVDDKTAVLSEICERRGFSLTEVAYVGDDQGDLDVMLAVGRAGGIPCAVADARPQVIAVAKYVTDRQGGRGAVRDVCDHIVSARRLASGAMP